MLHGLSYIWYLIWNWLSSDNNNLKKIIKMIKLSKVIDFL